MNKTQIVTLRVPVELKNRLAHEAKTQGVSINNLANYFLTTQLSQLEALSALDARMSKKNISTLKTKVAQILDAVPKNPKVPVWDTIKRSN